MRATEQGIRDIEANPLNVFVRGDAIEQLKATRAQIAQKLAQTSLQEQRSGERNTNRTTAQLSGIKRDQARHASTLRRAGAATALAAQRAGERSAGATRSGLLGVRGRLDESVRLERRILAKKRDIAITIKPGTTSVRLDGRKIASAMTKYGPAVQRHL